LFLKSARQAIALICCGLDLALVAYLRSTCLAAISPENVKLTLAKIPTLSRIADQQDMWRQATCPKAFLQRDRLMW